MRLNLPSPILYLITSGKTTSRTTPHSEDFTNILGLIEAAVAAGVSLIQLREKNLTARVLTALTEQAASLTRASNSKLLVNDRADIARAAGADGVHLTTTSLPADVVRKTFGADFVIGASTHTLEEAQEAKRSDADFVVFGPVFDTESKRKFGEPQGVEKLRQIVSVVEPLPVIAIGGVSLDNAIDCFRAGAIGVAAIRLLQNPNDLNRVTRTLIQQYEQK
ncbi:MAG: thiamine phosphate synthase [Blastocatellia bacterium]|nr:MAG: thiamine phosphate synthase [Blastocatellia bacterium]